MILGQTNAQIHTLTHVTASLKVLCDGKGWLDRLQICHHILLTGIKKVSHQQNDERLQGEQREEGWMCLWKCIQQIIIALRLIA